MEVEWLGDGLALNTPKFETYVHTLGLSFSNKYDHFPSSISSFQSSKFTIIVNSKEINNSRTANSSAGTVCVQTNCVLTVVSIF